MKFVHWHWLRDIQLIFFLPADGHVDNNKVRSFSRPLFWHGVNLHEFFSYVQSKMKRAWWISHFWYFVRCHHNLGNWNVEYVFRNSIVVIYYQAINCNWCLELWTMDAWQLNFWMFVRQQLRQFGWKFSQQFFFTTSVCRCVHSI